MAIYTPEMPPCAYGTPHLWSQESYPSKFSVVVEYCCQCLLCGSYKYIGKRANVAYTPGNGVPTLHLPTGWTIRDVRMEERGGRMKALTYRYADNAFGYVVLSWPDHKKTDDLRFSDAVVNAMMPFPGATGEGWRIRPRNRRMI